MTQAAKAQVDEVLYVPAALALHQRPGVPGIRSTFGTGTELLNNLRLMFSRLANHQCPNGHYHAPAFAVAAEQELVCPKCGVRFYAPSAEELAFNSQGACQACGGTGIVHTVDMATLVPDESLTIEQGAVAPWNSLMWSLMVDVCRAMGVRTDVPFRSLTAEACKMTLTELVDWVAGVPESLPEEMRPMAESICDSFGAIAKRLLDLGLGYLSLDRAASTLSTGERQRMQLARAVRNRTTGVLYVLDEPSIGLHPSNILGLHAVMRDLIADGNSVLLVDHDTQILSKADWLVEMGPHAGADGGRIIAEGTVREIIRNVNSQIGPFLSGKEQIYAKKDSGKNSIFEKGRIRLATTAIHTVKPLSVDVPQGKLTVVTGVSGSGKTTLILESLVPALEAVIAGKKLPEHIKAIEANGIERVKLIDAAPIGVNVRSTVATYANVHDELRKIFAGTRQAKRSGFKAGDFSYNTGKLRCPVCDGTGVISLDVQFLPDVEVPCPECRGSRYAKDAGRVKYQNKAGAAYSLPELMAMDIRAALQACCDLKIVHQRLQVLQNLGLGYLTLGEQTPSLSGGEAQRLKLAGEMGKSQSDSVFVFDEPTIGLHPLDVQTLLGVFQTLIQNGATAIVIEHDLDVIRNADYVIDMGPGGGNEGGSIIAVGSPEEIKNAPQSRTGEYL